MVDVQQSIRMGNISFRLYTGCDDFILVKKLLTKPNLDITFLI